MTSPLIGVDELAARLGEVTVLDVRYRMGGPPGPDEYAAGHVPGARWVDHAEWAKEFGDGRDAEGWGKRIGRLGIGSDSTVVVYDDSRSKDAARIWWVLRYWGVEDVRLLNGGGSDGRRAVTRPRRVRQWSLR